MDVLNSSISQNTMREHASAITNRTFSANGSIGFASGVSHFTSSQLRAVEQQVVFVQPSKLLQSEQNQASEDKKLKANKDDADTKKSEVSENFAGALEKANEMLQINGTKISFKFAETKNTPIVVVTEQDSGKVIRQIPSEDAIRIAEQLDSLVPGQSMDSGVLFNEKA